MRVCTLQDGVNRRPVGGARAHGLRKTQKVVQQEELWPAVRDVEEIIEMGGTEFVAFEERTEQLIFGRGRDIEERCAPVMLNGCDETGCRQLFVLGRGEDFTWDRANRHDGLAIVTGASGDQRQRIACPRERDIEESETIVVTIAVGSKRERLRALAPQIDSVASVT